jgi:hypothetical protein
MSMPGPDRFRNMNEDSIKGLVIEAVKSFCEHEKYLLEKDVSERAMAHKLAEHLQKKFYGMHVDCEYNKNIDDDKHIEATVSDYVTHKSKTQRARRLLDEIRANEGTVIIDDGEAQPEVMDVFPDIIIHWRGDGHPWNLVAIEIKKSSNSSRTQRDFDCFKLKKYTEEGSLQYRLGAFLTLKVGQVDGEDRYSGRWYKGGNEEDAIF